MTVLYTGWRFDNYKKGEFYKEKNKEKIVKLFLHLNYIVQNSFNFDEIFFIENFKTLAIFQLYSRYLTAVLGNIVTIIDLSL